MWSNDRSTLSLMETGALKPISMGSGIADNRLLNRELSWIEFNSRVLDEALDPTVPLLERLKFLAIFSSNLDEFFMVRVAGLKRQVDAGVDQGGADGLPPAATLAEIARRLHELVKRQHG